MHNYVRKGCAALALAAILQPGFAVAEEATSVNSQTVVIAPRSSDEVSKHVVKPEAEVKLTTAQKLALIKQHVKYVFVLFQENRAFDFYFGTYPGANGLFSQPAAQTPGFVQPIVNIDGSVGTISPFLIPTTVTVTGTNTVVPIYPADTASVDHSHSGIDNDLDVNAQNIPQNDRYALNAEGLTTSGGVIVSKTTGVPPTTPPTLAQKQTAELVLGHVDCNAAPVLWNYADKFTLFDNFFDTVIGPSTPNALGMFSGQSGLTQWVKHPEQSSLYVSTNMQLPVTADPQPFWGSALDTTPANEKQPVDNPGGVSSNPASNLTYASLGLSFMGSKIYETTSYDRNAGVDLADVQADIQRIAGDHNKATNWAWYQEGYDHEPTDPKGAATHYDYIAHHNAPQYFGYEANNPVETQAHLKGLGDFFTALQEQKLPSTGGVFYVRGGYGNLDGLTPQDPNPTVQADFAGNDDHPGYSDLQISSALIADEVNAIASSPYWSQSAIIITYDETDGEYDHTQPIVRSQDPEGNPLDQGPRVPAIVISPYAMTHAISHERTEHSSIIRFIDELYNLTPLADLPDESDARKLGEQLFGQKYMGPADAVVPDVGDMTSAFDNNRLTGAAPPLEASYAMIPTSQTLTLPQYGGNGCSALGITPTDYTSNGVIDPAPIDFNPRPATNPGIPTSGTWTP